MKLQISSSTDFRQITLRGIPGKRALSRHAMMPRDDVPPPQTADKWTKDGCMQSAQSTPFARCPCLPFGNSGAQNRFVGRGSLQNGWPKNRQTDRQHRSEVCVYVSMCAFLPAFVRKITKGEGRWGAETKCLLDFGPR